MLIHENSVLDLEQVQGVCAGGGGGALLGAVHCRHQFVELIFEWLMLLLSRRLPRAMRLI